MSLYRKYRPQDFDNLIGQEHIRVTLSNALKLGRVSHAYLFTGPRGTGKTTTARIMAKAINCLNLKDAKPCEECDICRDINEGRLIDVIEIDAASNRGIDEIRDLKEKINFAPTRAKNKVYIIDEVHMLTKEAFNALLKTLEEPPSHVYFILATTEVHKVPETILSRCQRFDFKRIDLNSSIERLRFIAKSENIEADEKALELISEHAQGGMRDAIGLLEQLSSNGKLEFDKVCNLLGISGYASMENLYGFLNEGSAQNGLTEIKNLYEQGFDLVNFNKSFLEYLRKKMLNAVEKNELDVVYRIIDWINHFQDAYEQAKLSPIAQLPLELAVVESCVPKANFVSVPQSSQFVGNMGVSGGANYGERMGAAPERGVSGTSGCGGSVGSANLAKTADSNNGGHSSETKEVKIDSAKNLVSSSFSASVSENTAKEKQLHSNEPALSGDFVFSKWGQVVQATDIPAAKQALSLSKFSRIDGSDIYLSCASNFYMEKIKENANRASIEDAFEKVLKVTVKIIPELNSAPYKGGSTGTGRSAGGNDSPAINKTETVKAIDNPSEKGEVSATSAESAANAASADDIMNFLGGTLIQ